MPSGDPLEDDEPDRTDGPKRIQSLDRAVALLKHVSFSREALGVAELAALTGLNRSTVWRLLMTLEHHGLVDRDPTGLYRPGAELLRMADAAPSHELLLGRARPVLDRLSAETRETVSLLVPTSTGVVSIDQRAAPRIAAVSIVGVRLPLHATASGKLRLALAPTTELPRLLERSLESFTPRTITDPAALDRELDRVRRAGYATERDEFEPGVSGVAAPVRDDRGDPVAFLSIWGLTARLPAERLAELASDVRASAAELESRLANRGLSPGA